MNPALKNRPFGIVIPAYQAAGSLPALLESLKALVPATSLLVVDDGSIDGTAERVIESGVFCLRHGANRGKGSALMTGLLHAARQGWEWAITLDADGQHPPDDVGRFLDARPTDRTGVLVGRRAIAGTRMPLHRRFSNAVTTWLVSRLAGGAVFDAQCGFRAYRLSLLDAYPREGRFEWESQALILCRRKGFDVEAVPVQTVYSNEGSHMRLGRDTLRFLRMVGRVSWMR